MKANVEVPAMDKLSRWLTGDRTQVWLAEKLKVDKGTVCRWIAGRILPSPELRQAISDLTKGEVDTDDWYTDDELERAYEFSRRRQRPQRERSAG